MIDLMFVTIMQMCKSNESPATMLATLLEVGDEGLNSNQHSVRSGK